MADGNRKRAENARERWELYLREIRPYVWERAALYALARGAPVITDEGSLCIHRLPLSPTVIERIEKLDAMIKSIGRRHGVGAVESGT